MNTQALLLCKALAQSEVVMSQLWAQKSVWKVFVLQHQGRAVCWDRGATASSMTHPMLPALPANPCLPWKELCDRKSWHRTPMAKISTNSSSRVQGSRNPRACCNSP